MNLNIPNIILKVYFKKLNIMYTNKAIIPKKIKKKYKKKIIIMNSI